MSIIEKALKSRRADSAARRGHEDASASTPEEGLRQAAGTPVDRSNQAEATGLPGQVAASPVAQSAPASAAMPGGSAVEAASREATSGDGPDPRPLVTLRLDDLRQRGFLIPNQPRSRIAEEFRGIKRPLLRNISPSVPGVSTPFTNANLIMVTSALQGDGKTFSSINLALSMAMEQEKSILFVDADVVRATAGKVLGVPRGVPGLIDVLDEKRDIDPGDVILRTNIPNLRILPAGNASDKSTELLASEAMHDFMLELSKRYPDRVIVFDSPPLLLTTEARALASFMGQIVFVASADITPQHAVVEALEQLGEDKIVGVVLNRASRRRTKLLGVGSYGYGYGYGYGYAYGNPAGEADADAPAAGVAPS